MANVNQNRAGRRHTYEINAAVVLKDLYRLLTLILSDEVLEDELEDEHDQLLELRDRFVEDELVHLLINTAVMNRLKMDDMRELRRANRRRRAQAEGGCGQLQPDMGNDRRIDLSFREACNKVIHAEHITFEHIAEQGAHYSPLQRALTLRGTFQDVPWQATLDVIRYVRLSVSNFSDLR